MTKNGKILLGAGAGLGVLYLLTSKASADQQALAGGGTSKQGATGSLLQPVSDAVLALLGALGLGGATYQGAGSGTSSGGSGLPVFVTGTGSTTLAGSGGGMGGGAEGIGGTDTTSPSSDVNVDAGFSFGGMSTQDIGNALAIGGGILAGISAMTGFAPGALLGAGIGILGKGMTTFGSKEPIGGATSMSPESMPSLATGFGLESVGSPGLGPGAGTNVGGSAFAGAGLGSVGSPGPGPGETSVGPDISPEFSGVAETTSPGPEPSQDISTESTIGPESSPETGAASPGDFGGGMSGGGEPDPGAESGFGGGTSGGGEAEGSGGSDTGGGGDTGGGADSDSGSGDSGGGAGEGGG